MMRNSEDLMRLGFRGIKAALLPSQTQHATYNGFTNSRRTSEAVLNGPTSARSNRRRNIGGVRGSDFSRWRKLGCMERSAFRCDLVSANGQT